MKNGYEKWIWLVSTRSGYKKSSIPPLFNVHEVGTSLDNANHFVKGFSVYCVPFQAMLFKFGILFNSIQRVPICYLNIFLFSYLVKEVKVLKDGIYKPN